MGFGISLFGIFSGVGVPAPALRAESHVLVTTDTTWNIGGIGFYMAMYDTNLVEITDGATLTIINTRPFPVTADNSGAFQIITGTTIIRPADGAADGTGRVVFENIPSTGSGGVIRLGAGTGLELTNALFRNNSTTRTTRGIGVLYSGQPDAYVALNNVRFEHNFSESTIGVMRSFGTLVMNGGGFYDNYTSGLQASGVIGALDLRSSTAKATLTDVVFEGNRAFGHSGALSTSGTAQVTLNNCIFVDNWAGTQGGAVIASLTNFGNLTFNYYPSGGTTNFYNHGNAAANTANSPANAPLVTPELVASNSIAFAPEARGGGFLYRDATGATADTAAIPADRITFNIAAGATLTIGDPDAADKNYDSITINQNNNYLQKTGAGTLVLNADNSFIRNNFYIWGGSLLLGNDEALFGATVEIRDGATFGGGGTLIGFDTNYNPLNRPVRVQAGATLQIGLADRHVEQLYIASSGGLSFSNSRTTLNYVAFGGTHAARLVVSGSTAVTLSGAGQTVTLNLDGFQTGVYELGNIASQFDGRVRFAVNGMPVSGNGRQFLDITAATSGRPNELAVSLQTDTLREMRFTGAAGMVDDAGVITATWNDEDENWTDVAGNGIAKFAALDTAAFADVTGTINLPANVAASQLTVTGTGTLTFAGAGGIRAREYDQNLDAEDAVQAAGAGKLVKDGDGTLYFRNTGGNNFAGGIEIRAGRITINSNNQLGAGAGGITFAGTGTLHSTSANATIADAIHVASAAVATFNAAADLRLDGPISGGAIEKTGAAMLVLGGSNSHASLTFRSGTLGLAHAHALGAGALNIAGDDLAIGTVDSGIMVATPVDFAGNTVRLFHSGAGASGFAGSLRGTGAISAFSTGGGVLQLAGENTFATLDITAGAVAARHRSALGGAGAAVTVQGGAALHVTDPGTGVGDLLVRTGATLGFNDPRGTMLNAAGAVTIEDGATVSLLTRLTSGYSTLVHAAGGINIDTYSVNVDPGPNNAVLRVYTDDATGDLKLMNMNRAGNPGKDIAVSLDAMAASTASLYDRINEAFLLPRLGAGVTAGASRAPRETFWTKVVGSYADYDGNVTRTGYTDLTYGVTGGMDFLPAKNVFLGVFFGLSSSNLETTPHHARTDSTIPHFGGYAAWKPGSFYVAGDAYGASVTASTKRTDDETTGHYKATIVGAGAEAGLVIPAWRNAILKPSAGLRYTNYDYHDHAEAGPGAIYVDDFYTSRLEGVLAAQLSHYFTTFRGRPAAVELRAGWRSILDSERTVLRVAFANLIGDKFDVPSDTYAADRLTLGFGVRASLARKVVLAAGYDGEFSQNHTRHAFNATVTINL